VPAHAAADLRCAEATQVTAALPKLLDVALDVYAALAASRSSA
jgi:hypothetical protein